MAEDSGKLTFKEGMLSYESPTGAWSLAVHDIRLIGEYTTSDGPALDDYFYAFIVALEGGWYEASAYAEGAHDALLQVGAALGSELQSELYNSAHWKTRIIWPDPWRGHALLEVVPAERRRGVWQRLFSLQMPDTAVPSKAMHEIFGREKAPNQLLRATEQGKREE